MLQVSRVAIYFLDIIHAVYTALFSMCLRLFFVNTDSAFTACKDTELCQKVRTVNYEKHRRVLKKGLKKDLKNVLKNVFKNILKKIVAV